MPVTLFGLLLALAACQTPSGNEQSRVTPGTTYPALMHEIWDAHGGIENWLNKQALTFTIQANDEVAESHTINLGDRKVLIESDSFRIGRDATGVWISPSPGAFDGNARFYHNLYF